VAANEASQKVSASITTNFAVAVQDGGKQELPVPVAAAVAATPVTQAFTSADLPLVGASHTNDKEEEEDDGMSELSMPEKFNISHGLTLQPYCGLNSTEMKKEGKTYKLYELLLPTVKKAGQCTYLR